MPALQAFIASSISIRLWAAIVAPLANAMIINSSERPTNANGHQMKSPHAGRKRSIAIIPKIEMPASIMARLESLLGDKRLLPGPNLVGTFGIAGDLMALATDLGVEQVHEEGQLVGTRLATPLSDMENRTVMLAQHVGSVLLLLPDGHITISLA